MKRDLKKIYGYGAIMFAAVIIILVITCLSDSKINNNGSTYENMLIERKDEIQKLKEKIIVLEEEKEQLKKNLQIDIELQSKMDKHNQIMSELTEIYNLIDGDKALAEDKLSKIEVMGFDDGEIAFYEAIKKLLEM